MRTNRNGLDDSTNRDRFIDAIATGEIAFPVDGNMDLASSVREQRRSTLVQLIAKQIATELERESGQSKEGST